MTIPAEHGFNVDTATLCPLVFVVGRLPSRSGFGLTLRARLSLYSTSASLISKCTSLCICRQLGKSIQATWTGKLGDERREVFKSKVSDRKQHTDTDQVLNTVYFCSNSSRFYWGDGLGLFCSMAASSQVPVSQCNVRSGSCMKPTIDLNTGQCTCKACRMTTRQAQGSVLQVTGRKKQCSYCGEEGHNSSSCLVRMADQVPLKSVLTLIVC